MGRYASEFIKRSPGRFLFPLSSASNRQCRQHPVISTTCARIRPSGYEFAVVPTLQKHESDGVVHACHVSSWIVRIQSFEALEVCDRFARIATEGSAAPIVAVSQRITRIQPEAAAQELE